MNFETVRLSASAIADLYRQSLVLVDDVQPAIRKTEPPSIAALPPKAEATVVVPPTEAVSPPPVIRYTGGFQQQISVVISDATHTGIAPDDFDLLKKLMGACKLTPEDFAIINVLANPETAGQIWQLMPARVVLMFGVRSNDIGIPFYRPDFQVQHWNNAAFMGAPPLASFQGPDTPELKARKRELWEGLQKLFLGKS